MKWRSHETASARRCRSLPPSPALPNGTDAARFQELHVGLTNWLREGGDEMRRLIVRVVKVSIGEQLAEGGPDGVRRVPLVQDLDFN